ncbi:MAG: ribbon-helix-helix protein, CopG family [Candidatus Tectomicrobia bacterium]|nr:ribbon-helix-helix protein, CopG family [Candidatus Tectomicrobia bacterium]
MPSTTVRISDKSRKLLRELAAREGKSMQVILEKVIEEYRRQRFLEDVNAAYAALRQDPETWARVKQEQATWDGTLIDGLDPGEVWTENGEVIRKNRGKKRS